MIFIVKFTSVFSGLFLLFSVCSGYSQEEGESRIDVRADFVSGYIWRGLKLGSGPAVQPAIEYSRGVFTAGAWGSFDFRNYEEVDLYIAFSFPSGISFGLTDYYSPGLDFFDFSRESGSHAMELNLAYEGRKVSLSANYIFNEAAGIGSYGNDLYFEAGYSFSHFSLLAGAGNGWLTTEGENSGRFIICNIGIEAVKVIQISENFEIPLTGQLIFNPAGGRLDLVGVVSF